MRGFKSLFLRQIHNGCDVYMVKRFCDVCGEEMPCNEPVLGSDTQDTKDKHLAELCGAPDVCEECRSFANLFDWAGALLDLWRNRGKARAGEEKTSEPEEAPRRGRKPGRPPKTATSGNGEEPVAKRRGRPLKHESSAKKQPQEPQAPKSEPVRTEPTPAATPVVATPKPSAAATHDHTRRPMQGMAPVTITAPAQTPKGMDPAVAEEKALKREAFNNLVEYRRSHGPGSFHKLAESSGLTVDVLRLMLDGAKVSKSCWARVNDAIKQLKAKEAQQ